MAGEVLGSAVIEVGADTTGLRKDVDTGVKGAFSKTAPSAQAAGTSASKRFGGTFLSGMRGVAASAGAVLGVGALVGLAKSSVNVAAEFEQTMNVLQAATKAPAAAMDDLSDLAIKMGRDTVFSANEAATAMLELAKGGIKPAAIEAGALDATLTLAAAGGVGLGEAATVASNALNAFGLQAKDSGEIAAALAGGANASTASVSSLAQALGQVGPGAVDAGLSLQETVGALAAFDNAGIKGSDAGTSLKTMLANLIPTTEKQSTAMEKLGLDFTDAQGNFVSLANIAEQLQDSMGDLGQAERSAALEVIFGSDARRAASILVRQGAEGIRDLTEATSDQTAAEKMANARMKGTKGALEALSGSWETLQLAMGKALAPAVVKGADALTGSLNDMGPAAEKVGSFIADDLMPAAAAAVDEFKEWLPVIRDVGGDFTSALLPPLEMAAGVIKTLVEFAGDLPGPIKTIGLEAVVLGFAFNRVSGTITQMTAAVGGNIASLRQWQAEMTYAETRAGAVATATGKLASAAKAAAGIGGMLALTNGLSSASDAGASFSNVLTGTVGGALTGLAVGGPIGALIGAAGGGGLTALTGAFSDNKREAEAQARALAEAQQEAADHRNFIDQLTDSLDRNTGAFTRNSNEIIRSNFIDKETGETKEWVAALNDAGISNRGIIAAVKGQPAALAAVNDVLDDQATHLGRVNEKIDELEARKEFVENWKPPGAGASLEQIDKFNQRQATNIANLDRLIAKKREEEAATKSANAAIRAGIDDGQEAQKQRQQEINDLARLHRVLGVTADRFKEFPKELRTELNIRHLPESAEDLNKLTRGIKGLTEGDWKILLKTAGFDGTAKELDRAARIAAEKGKVAGKGWTTGFGGALASLPENLRGAVQRAGDQAESTARASSARTGASFATGFAAGIRNNVSAGVNAAVSMVSQAVAAANAEAKVKSPSKVTEELGRWMGKGLEKGLMESGTSLVDSIKQMMADLIDGLSKGARAAAQRTVGEFRSAAIPLAREIDRVKAKIAELNEFRRSTTQSIIGGFNITSAGTGFDSILRSMQVNAADTAAFASALQGLAAGGLNKTTLRQIAEAGPSALAQAEALLSREGGIAQVNALQSQINTSAGAAAKAAGNALYAGVREKRAALASEFRVLAREFASEFRRSVRGTGDGRDRGVRRATRTTTGGGGGGGAAPVAARSVVQNIHVEQKFTGPVTGRRAVREMEWTLRYGTGARRLAEVG